jgi:hypothetical protein
VLLHVDSDVLTERIKGDQVDVGACQWRLDHISDYEKARPWMEAAADLVIDTTRVPVAEVAERIAVSAERRMAAASSLCGVLARPGPPGPAVAVAVAVAERACRDCVPLGAGFCGQMPHCVLSGAAGDPECTR